jgi:hypothetical protein
MEERVIGEELAELAVDLGDVRRIARESRPPERTDPTTEERPDIGRDEARVCEGVLYSRLIRLPS